MGTSGKVQALQDTCVGGGHELPCAHHIHLQLAWKPRETTLRKKTVPKLYYYMPKFQAVSKIDDTFSPGYLRKT